MNSPVVAGAPRESESLEPPFAPAPVAELLRLVSKAARAHQMYLPNNPIYRGAIEALRTGFAPVWAETEEIELTIGESEIRWYDAVVAGTTGADAKSPDNLAWLFYKDGVRELTLTRGVEQAEIVKLLEIIQRARKATPTDDDLVTMLWEADFVFLKYRYVDLLQEGGGGELVDGTAVAPVSNDAIKRGAQDAVAESKAGRVVNMADFDATLYFLDPNEIEYLQQEIAREYAHDLRANLIGVLLDIFEAQGDSAIRSEVLENVQTLLVSFLAGGHFRGVAHLLREARTSVNRANRVTTEHQEQLGRLADRLSAPDALSQLLQALDGTPILPPDDELAELFDQLRPTALATVFQWLARTQNEHLRPSLENAAERLASANTSELVRLIQSAEPDVSSEAIRRAGALKAQAAVLSLAKILGEPDVSRRQVAVQALANIGSPGALQALEKAIEDADREVRINAVRAIGARAYRPALSRLEGVVTSRALRDADLTEKMAFFEGYGALCGDAGVSQLDSMLNGKGFLGRREDPEIRACAAIALGRVGSAKAIDALRKASGEKDVIVRNAVTRALRGGGSAQ